MNLLAQRASQGRRFELDHFLEVGDQVAVALHVADPEWDGSVEVAKVFRFRSIDEKVVVMQDCRDWADALHWLDPTEPLTDTE